MTPLAAEEELQVPGCYPYGVRAGARWVGEKPPYARRLRPVVH